MFPIRDITHQPKRYQNENVGDVPPVTMANPSDLEGSVPPVALTIEGAVEFYERSGASGQLGNLYKQTAVWLREYLAMRSPALIEAYRALQKAEEEKVLEELSPEVEEKPEEKEEVE